MKLWDIVYTTTKFWLDEYEDGEIELQHVPSFIARDVVKEYEFQKELELVNFFTYLASHEEEKNELQV